MQAIAHVVGIRRYPVKSMGGEALPRCRVGPGGLAGDRVWAVCDAAGEIRSARQWPRLLEFTARFAGGGECAPGVTGSAVPEVLVRCPDGTELASRTPESDAGLGAALGRQCTLEPLRAASEREFYRHRRQLELAEVERDLNRLPDEGELDFSQTPGDMLLVMAEYMTPPGTFFDIFPLHLLSTQALVHLGASRGVDARVERFRPNLVLEFVDPAQPVPEFALVGRELRIGALTVRPRGRTIRCAIPSRAQPQLGLAAEPPMTRAIVELLARHLGIYATVEGEAVLQVGDPVYLV